MRTCARGHEYRGDENYRARRGRCPVCFKAVRARYRRSAKARADDRAYNHSDKGADRYARYNQSPKGWKNALNKRRSLALKRRAQRTSAEDEGGQ